MSPRPLRLWWVGLAVCLAAQNADAVQRTVKTRAANYDDSPVLVQNASIHMVQTYSTPGQVALVKMAGPHSEGRATRSRVRVANRLNQEIETYLLEGNVDLRNDTGKTISAFRITAIFLNAFQERIEVDQQMIQEPLGPGQQRQVPWNRQIPHQEVFEVVIVVTAVRYSDGTVWAPTEELVLVP